MQIAIVSAAPAARKLAGRLRPAEIRSQECSSVSDVTELAELFSLDLVLIDASRAGQVEKAVRTLGRLDRTVPVMAFCQRPDRETSLACFAAGADDVVAWPGDAEIIAARIRSVVRRSRGADAGVLHIGPLSFDMIRRSLRVGDRQLSLTTKEYHLLEYMVTRRNTMLTKNALLDQLYGGKDAPDSRIIDVFVCKLRKKLALSGVQDLIETVRGTGYRLNENKCRFATPAPRFAAVATAA